MEIYNPFSLIGKTILVTGASSGIGRSIAIEASKMGATLIITGRDKERLNETYTSLMGNNHLQFIADLNESEAVDNLVDSLPSINGVVLALGIGDWLPFQFVKKERLYRIFETNFFAPVILIQKLLKGRKVRKGSSIVFLSSIDGPVTAHIGNSMYAASKGAVSAMVKGMAVDLASKEIRVNALLPGMIETPLIHCGDITEEPLKEDKKLYPLRRYGKPEEIAYAAIYLLSNASSFTTGANLVIDGGFTLL